MKRGEVFIAPLDPVPPGRMADPAGTSFGVSWQDSEEGVQADSLEDDEVEGAEAAIAWGRARSDIVWIRLGHSGDTYFSAGETHPADDDPEEYVPHWPPQVPPAGWWYPPPRPELEDVERMAARLQAGELSEQEAADWATERLAMSLRYDVGLDPPTLNALHDLRGHHGPTLWGDPGDG